MRHRKLATRRRAFTLVEAVVAMTITAIAASALLLGVNSALLTTIDAEEQALATGIAQQVLDEVLGTQYCLARLDAMGRLVAYPYDTVLQPSAAKAAPGTRELFTDTDDFNGFRNQPPVDTWGVALGTEDSEGRQRHPNFRAVSSRLNHWREEIAVYYVDESDLTRRLPQGRTSDYRAIEVIVSHVDGEGVARELARVRQVVAYVPPMQ